MPVGYAWLLKLEDPPFQEPSIKIHLKRYGGLLKVDFPPLQFFIIALNHSWGPASAPKGPPQRPLSAPSAKPGAECWLREWGGLQQRAERLRRSDLDSLRSDRMRPAPNKFEAVRTPAGRKVGFLLERAVNEMHAENI